jgi:hypothetical protein
MGNHPIFGASTARRHCNQTWPGFGRRRKRLLRYNSTEFWKLLAYHPPVHDCNTRLCPTLIRLGRRFGSMKTGIKWNGKIRRIPMWKRWKSRSRKASCMSKTVWSRRRTIHLRWTRHKVTTCFLCQCQLRKDKFCQWASRTAAKLVETERGFVMGRCHHKTWSRRDRAKISEFIWEKWQSMTISTSYVILLVMWTTPCLDAYPVEAVSNVPEGTANRIIFKF